jgi:hypothetical protein
MWEEVCWTPEPLLSAQRVAIQVGVLSIMSSSSVVLWVPRRLSVSVGSFGLDVLVQAVVGGQIIEDI